MSEKPTYEELVQRLRELEKREAGLRQSMAEMSKAQSSLESALESTADGILVVGKDGFWTKFNKKFIDMWDIPGFISEKGDDTTALEYVSVIVEDPEEFMAAVNDLYRNPEKESFDAFKVKDGRVFERYSIPQRFGGEIIGRVWSFRDVTGRKQIEMALRESEERFRELAELLPEAVFETDWDMNLTYANRRAHEIFGYTEEEMRKGIYGLDVFIPEDRKRLKDAIARRMKGESLGRTEYQALRKDGSTFPVLFHASSVRREGALTGLRGVVIDMTEIKRAEEILKQEKEKAETYLRIAGVIMVALDSSGTVTMINRKGCEILGYDESDIVGKNWFDNFLPRRVVPDMKSISQKLLRGDIVEISENPILTSSGEERLIAWHNTILRDDSGGITGFLSSGEDITERRRAEAEKKELQEQYQQSQKVESLGRLAGGVAHDLNNLLTPILGYCEILLADIEVTDKRRKSVNEIMKAGFRARDLVKQLLAFGRKQTLDYQLVDLNKTVTEFEPLLRRTIRENIDISITTSYERCTIMADVGQIEQVLLNLAVNAQDAMAGGGNLAIETTALELEGASEAYQQGIEPGEYVVLKVSDTGSGMEKEILDKIFEPFFTTKGEMGTGLGLATVYGIVKQHEGNVFAHSQPGKGTTIEVYLPASNAPAGIKKLRTSTGRELMGSERILLVEDDEQVRYFTETTLKRHGYKVQEAGSGEDAMALLEEASSIPDLLLADVILPGMNGSELYKAVEAKFPAMKVLYMSGYTDNAIAHHGVLDEGVAFIQKPFAGQALAIKLREVLDG